MVYLRLCPGLYLAHLRSDDFALICPFLVLYGVIAGSLLFPIVPLFALTFLFVAVIDIVLTIVSGIGPMSRNDPRKNRVSCLIMFRSLLQIVQLFALIIPLMYGNAVDTSVFGCLKVGHTGFYYSYEKNR